MFYGWVIVGVAATIYMLVVGTTYSAFGLLVLPVSAEFKLSRASMNSALILLNIGNACLAPIIGRLLDRLPVRPIIMVAALLLGGSLAALGLSRSLWLSATIIVLPLAAGILGASTLSMSVLIARWFVAHRGRAMMLAAIGMSAGSILVTPLVGWLIAAEGWRAALLITGGTITALLLALALLLRDRPPVEQVPVGQGRPAAGPGPAPVRALLAMPQFWTVSLSVSITLGTALALSVTLVPLALQGGLSMVQATSLVSVTGGAAIASKLLLSTLADRIDRILLLTGLFALAGGLNAALLLDHSYPVLLCIGVGLGIATGVVAPIFYALLADRFGPSSFGTVRGLMAPIGAVISALAVRLAGEVFDRTGGYATLFTVFIGLQVLAVVLIYATRHLAAVPPAGAVPAREPR
ncbi:MFS transporter [Sphingomonas solaris]|nr:MFS transporter [Sphingomonas solaris]